ncbi:MAG: FG-GAP repeat domain-containing protein [Solirubrobacteraceae bacterium]
MRLGLGGLTCVLSAVVLVVLGTSPVAARLSTSGSRVAAHSQTDKSPQSVFADAGCPDTSTSYDGPCGPLFSTPQWSDTTAWAQPSSYETIQLAKLDGAGEDLIGRDATGLWVEKFDASKGQWELLGNADGGLALSLPDTEGWNRPSQYRTIQTANLDGDGKTELLARAADGLHVYRWNPATATFVDISKPPRLFSNGAGGDQPSVYETIQTADLFGDGHEELLARTPSGIEWARWNEHTGHFGLMTQTGIAPDAHGGGQPSLYQTIQTADVSGDRRADLLLAANALRRYVLEPDGRYSEEPVLPTVDHAHGFDRPSQYETVRAVRIDGRQRAAVVARFANGLHVYELIDGKWSTAAPVLGELSDADGFDRPDQYRTIRAGDVTGHGRLDVVARTAAGITVWELEEGAWVRLSSGPTLTGPVWAQASHYDTIRLGDINGNGHAALVVRGVFGMRTFIWYDGAFRRPLPYGDFPSFSGAEAAAYAEVSRLLLDRAGDFRKETYASPQSAITEATLNGYRGRLAERCTPVAAAQAPTTPPRYTECRPPAGSGLEPAAWTAVSNQIIGELWAAAGVVAHFSILDHIETKLFQDQQGMLPALAADLTLPHDPPDRTPVFLKLIRGITDILSNVFQFFPAAKDYPRVLRSIAVTAQALGAVSDGLGLKPEPSPAQSYAKIIAEIPKIQQRERDITQAQRRYVLADYGLLSAIGAEVKGRLLTLDETAALSSGRHAFAVWATKLYLPVYWARYRAINCGRYRFSKHVYVCDVPHGTFVRVIRHHQKLTDFNAALVGSSGCKKLFLETSCRWVSPEGATFTRVTTPLSKECRYDPAPGSIAACGTVARSAFPPET